MLSALPETTFLYADARYRNMCLCFVVLFVCLLLVGLGFVVFCLFLVLFNIVLYFNRRAIIRVGKH